MDTAQLVMDELDRYHLALAAIRWVPGLEQQAPEVVVELQGRLDAHHHFVGAHGDDLPEIRDWTWPR